ncbi:hypothetical protein G6F32_015870 [Rhizopus arrhizus]|nr:hypothetical protein G6F32_015870 [Rhizopus arrhizus]
MSTNAAALSISPENMRWNSSFSTCAWCLSRSATTASAVSSSCSDSASSSSSVASVRPSSTEAMPPTVFSRLERSRPRFWAYSALFQTSGLSSSRVTSSRRAFLAS